MEMTGSRERFGNDKPLWKQIRGHLLQFPDHKATEKENSSKNLRKTKEKERAKNQAVTAERFKSPNPPPVRREPPFICPRGCHSGTQEV